MAHPRTYSCSPSKEGKTASCLPGWEEAVSEMSIADNSLGRQQLTNGGVGWL